MCQSLIEELGFAPDRLNDSVAHEVGKGWRTSWIAGSDVLGGTEP